MTSAKRAYRKRRSAQLEAETRLRITEAAVDLHGSIGPARTTISAVAERVSEREAIRLMAGMVALSARPDRH